MSTYNIGFFEEVTKIGFFEEVTKIIFKLSSNII